MTVALPWSDESGMVGGVGDRDANERNRRADARDNEAAARDRRADARDREADARDRRADARDHEAAARDRRADARDHEADARDRDSLKKSVEGERLDHVFEAVASNVARLNPADRSDSARLRDLSAEDRASSAEDRRQAQVERDKGAVPASAVAAERDLLADRRDVAADARDASSDVRDQNSNERDSTYSQAVAADAEHRDVDRDRATLDRERSAGNREDSSANRDDSQQDREFSATDRHETRHRHQGEITNMEEQHAAAFQDSRRDSLTGLANRRELDERLAQGFDGDSPPGFSPVLMFCDIDHFKQINDEHGHAAGDSVLKVVGARIAGTVSATDLAARVGGDEFVVVTDQPTTIAQALEFANQVRLAVSEPIPLRLGSGPVKLKVNVSIGLASAAQCLDGRQLLGKADMALREAKNSGRDRCVPYLDQEAPGPDRALH